MDFYDRMAQWKQEHGDVLDAESDGSPWNGPGPFPRMAWIVIPIPRPRLDWLWRLLDRHITGAGYQR